MTYFEAHHSSMVDKNIPGVDHSFSASIVILSALSNIRSCISPIGCGFPIGSIQGVLYFDVLMESVELCLSGRLFWDFN